MVKKILLIGAVVIALASVSLSAIAEEPINLSVYTQLLDVSEGAKAKVFNPFYKKSKIESTCVTEPSFLASIDTQVERFYYLLVSDDRKNDVNQIKNSYFNSAQIHLRPG